MAGTHSNTLASIPVVSDSLIRYPQFNRLSEDIRTCQEMSRVSSEPQCMCLEGVTGAGKSMLVRDYAANYPTEWTDEGATITVLYAEMPAPATVKGVAAAMLERLGDPAASKGTLWSMNSRLINLIVACKVQIVILDDFQHLIDSETARIRETVSDWLKVLIKETGVPFLVIGMEGEVEPILDSNKQLSRLFAFRDTLRPFVWENTAHTGINDFVQFVAHAERAVGVKLSPECLGERREEGAMELLYRIHYATEGVVGNVMNLMRLSALFARQKKRSDIDLPILATAFEHRLAKHLKLPVNPFEVPIAQRFVAPLAAPVTVGGPATGQTRTKGRRKKAGGASLRETLKTR